MTTYARVTEDFAIEIFIPPAGVAIEDCFHPDLLPEFEIVPDGTQQNALRVDGEWINPDPPPEPEGEAP